MTTAELKARTKDFALRVIRLVDALPNSVKCRAIANQIVRSATSVAANHRAACRARSRVEFIAKIGIVIIDSKIRSKAQIEPLLKEAGELVAIMAASRKSAIGNRKSAI
jgi:hypothetical protein